MADNYVTNPGAGGVTFAGDEDGALVQWPLIKLAWGQLDTFNILADAAGKRLPMALNEINVTVPISAAALPLPAGAATSAKQDAIIAALGSPLQAGGNVGVLGSVEVVNDVGNPLPVNGTVTAIQGAPNTPANAWPAKVTDGTNVAAVKAASTAAAAADPALVVALNPQGPSLIGVTVGGGAVASVATVKAASTQPAATDTPLVVTVSPVQPIPLGLNSASNGSTATLAANATFTGAAAPKGDQTAIGIQAFSDVSGTLQLQESTDGVNWDQTSSWPLVGGFPLAVGATLTAAQLRVVYTNGPVAQGVFRLGTLARGIAPAGDVNALQDTISGNTARAQMTQARIIGPTQAGSSVYAAAAVKAAGVAPAASDPAQVVTLSPNSQLQNIGSMVELLNQILAVLQAMHAQEGAMSGQSVDPSNFLNDQYLQ